MSPRLKRKWAAAQASSGEHGRKAARGHYDVEKHTLRTTPHAAQVYSAVYHSEYVSFHI